MRTVLTKICGEESGGRICVHRRLMRILEVDVVRGAAIGQRSARAGQELSREAHRAERSIIRDRRRRAEPLQLRAEESGFEARIMSDDHSIRQESNQIRGDVPESRRLHCFTSPNAMDMGRPKIPLRVDQRFPSAFDFTAWIHVDNTDFENAMMMFG